MMQAFSMGFCAAVAMHAGLRQEYGLMWFNLCLVMVNVVVILLVNAK